MEIKKVTILGANGTMGSNVAGIFASFGNARVYMVSRTKEKSEKAIEKAVKSVRADAIRAKLEAKDYSELEECIREADLVFESVAEDRKIKEQILSQIAAYASENLIICSGTSGLSIDDMVKVLPNELKRNYLGMHFFNPPYNLTLCELIPSEYTEQSLVKKIKEYATEKLFRTVVVSKDKPAFIGNRIGFQFINLALKYAEKYQHEGGIDYIDAIMGPFTGRNIAPIRTADFVGLDIHKAIVDNVYQNTNDYAKEHFVLPGYVEKLIKEGKIGKKAGEGLYKTVIEDDGKKSFYVYDIETGKYRKTKNYKFEFINKMVAYEKEGRYKEALELLASSNEQSAEICRTLLAEYIMYSLYVNKEVGYTIHDADDAMATGFSWIPPLALVESFDDKEAVVDMIKETLPKKEWKECGIDELFKSVERSQYNYKKFLKARY